MLSSVIAIMGQNQQTTPTSSSNPSGFTPPPTPSGMTQLFFDDFLGTTLNTSLWTADNGLNAQGADWLPSHVTIGSYGSTPTPSVCNLNMYYDLAGTGTTNNNWVGGAIGAYGTQIPVGSQVYVACRMDPYSAGYLTIVDLLIGFAGNFPPEIDFIETFATASGDVTTNTVSAHYGSGNSQVQYSISNVDITIWHVWGLLWGSSTISLTLDGNTWASFANPDNNVSDPHSLVQPQILHLAVQTGDGGTPAQNTSIVATNPVKQQIDWVVVFAP